MLDRSDGASITDRSEPTTGQEKWQAGPATAIAFSPETWLLGVLAQNPISFGGAPDRADANASFLQPFVNYRCCIPNFWHAS